MLDEIIRGWTNPDNWKEFFRIYQSKESIILFFISLYIPFKFSYKAKLLENDIDSYYYNLEVFEKLNSRFMKNQQLTYEVLDFLKNLRKEPIKLYGRNNLKLNRKRTYLEGLMLDSLKKLCENLNEKNIDDIYYNCKKVNSIRERNKNISNNILYKFFNNEKVKLTAKDLEDITVDLIYIKDNNDQIKEQLINLQEHIEECSINIDKSLKKHNLVYKNIKFVPYYIIFLLVFTGVMDINRDWIFVWSIYSLVLTEAYNCIYVSLQKYNKFI